MIRAIRILIQSVRVGIARFWCATTPESAEDIVFVRRELHAHTQETKLYLMKKGLL